MQAPEPHVPAKLEPHQRLRISGTGPYILHSFYGTYCNKTRQSEHLMFYKNRRREGTHLGTFVQEIYGREYHGACAGILVLGIGLPYPQVGGNSLCPSRNGHTFVREYHIMSVLFPALGYRLYAKPGKSEGYLAFSPNGVCYSQP